LVILARQPRKPERRLDQLQLGVDVSLLQLIDQEHRGVAEFRQVAGGELYLERPVEPIAELFHYAPRFGPVLSDVGIVTGKRFQHVGWHAPNSIGWRQHKATDLVLAFAEDVDKC